MKNLAKSVQLSDIDFQIRHSKNKKSPSKNSFSVKTSLSNEQKEEQKCPVADKSNGAKTPREASNGKGRGTKEL